MKDLLLYIAQNLVEHPEQVTVTEVENGDELTLQLRVAPEDMGKVIGRQGRIAKRSALSFGPTPSVPAPRCLWILLTDNKKNRLLAVLFC